ncbi:MAG: ATP-binding protein [Halobacterium sp.]
MAERGDELAVTEDDVTLPAADVLTGRGFVTGKSGSGKSNTASVLVEELLDLDARLLIVDTDGEYYGLKEDYEVLHLGAGDRCDAAVRPGDAETIADLALAEGVPVVLDVSGFLDADEADRLVYEVTKHLFSLARDVRQPFLLLVEEVHEFVPEQGGLDDVGEMLVRVAKRGRKRGLGLCGLSQRPASVDKDFITQCDWIVWHRLTWANDTRVVDQILGGSYSTDVESLGDGEAFLQADWEQDVRRVQFRRKRTFDAGATPGFGEADDPDLRPVDPAWLERFESASAERSSGDAGGTGDDGAGGDDSGDAGGSDADESEGQSEDSSDGSSGGDADSQSGDQSRSDSSRGSTGGGWKSPGARTEPASDPRTAVWELGQLVAHVGRAAAGRTASGLLRAADWTVHAADRGLVELGRRVRVAGLRGLAAVDGDRQSGPLPHAGGVDRERDAATDRVVGVGAVLAGALLAYAALAVA